MKETAIHRPLHDAITGCESVRRGARCPVIIPSALCRCSFTQHLNVELMSGRSPTRTVYRIAFRVLFPKYVNEVVELIRHADDGLHLRRIQHVGVRVQEVERRGIRGARGVRRASDAVEKAVTFAIPVTDGVLGRVSSAHAREAEATVPDGFTTAPQPDCAMWTVEHEGDLAHLRSVLFFRHATTRRVRVDQHWNWLFDW